MIEASKIIRQEISAQIIRVLSPVIIVVAIGGIISTLLLQPNQLTRIVPSIVSIAFLTISLLFVNKGKINLAAHFVIGIISLAILVGMSVNGGVRAPIYALVMVVICISAWFYGLRKMLLLMIVWIIIGGIFVWLGNNNYLPDIKPPSDLLIWIYFSLFLLLLLAAIVIPTRMLHIALETSEIKRKETEQARKELKAAQDYISNIIDSMPLMLVGVDTDCNITQWNKIAENTTGVLFDFAKGKHLSEISPHLFSESNNIAESIQKCETKKDQKQIYLENGEVSYEEITIYPLKSSDVAGAVLIIDNVTEKIKLQNEILTLNEQLEQKIDERTKTLNDTVDSLKQTQDQLIRSERLAALGNMVAGVAHEINTPLGLGVTESSFLHDILTDVVNQHESKNLTSLHFQQQMATMQASSNALIRNLSRAADLINTFKQVAVDQVSIEHRVFNFHEYLKGIILNLQSKLKQTKHKISIECPKELSICSHPGAFAQIITNLIMNSLLHGFENIIQGEIKFTIAEENRYLHFQYQDNGIGMDSETLKQVFDPFFTTKRNKGGTGLGMQIVYNLVKQVLKGDIYCTSLPDDGVAFFIKIPLLTKE